MNICNTWNKQPGRKPESCLSYKLPETATALFPMSMCVPGEDHKVKVKSLGNIDITEPNSPISTQKLTICCPQCRDLLDVARANTSVTQSQQDFVMICTTVALFYCVYDGYKYTFGSGTQLIVIPKIDDTKVPSVNLRKSKKELGEEPTSACVATSYPSPNHETLAYVDGKMLNLTNQFMLQNFENNWIYSTIAWDISENPTCRVHYNKKDYFSENPQDEASQTCPLVSDIGPYFETDTILNTLSTTVLGMRFLAIKAVLFNIITTLRLWSA
ncbi:T cell receptor alpha chain MC.7.G5-like [Discoglossus pictus]